MSSDPSINRQSYLESDEASAVYQQRLISQNIEVTRELRRLEDDWEREKRAIIGEDNLQSYQEHRRLVDEQMRAVRPAGIRTADDVDREEMLRKKLVIESRRFLGELGINVNRVTEGQKRFAEQVGVVSERLLPREDKPANLDAARDLAWWEWDRPPYFDSFASTQNSISASQLRTYFQHEVKPSTGAINVWNMVTTFPAPSGGVRSGSITSFGELHIWIRPQVTGPLHVNLELLCDWHEHGGCFVDRPGGWNWGYMQLRTYCYARIGPLIGGGQILLTPIVTYEGERCWNRKLYVPGQSIITPTMDAGPVNAGYGVKLIVGLKSYNWIALDDMDAYSAVSNRWVVQGVKIAVP